MVCFRDIFVWYIGWIPTLWTMKIKYSDLKRVKQELIKIQDWLCPICQRDLSTLKSRDVCVDHNHNTGYIRAVLCRSCNSMEGRVYKLFIRMGLRKAGVDYYRYLHYLAWYIDTPDTCYLHPKHKVKK